MDYGMWDISRLLEQWACAKTKGSRTMSTLSTMQKECSSIINGTLSMYFIHCTLPYLILFNRNGFSVSKGTYELLQL
jgi:hypothetical protein